MGVDLIGLAPKSVSEYVTESVMPSEAELADIRKQAAEQSMNAEQIEGLVRSFIESYPKETQFTVRQGGDDLHFTWHAWTPLWMLACMRAGLEVDEAGKGGTNDAEIINEATALRIADRLEPLLTDDALWEEWQTRAHQNREMADHYMERLGPLLPSEPQELEGLNKNFTESFRASMAQSRVDRTAVLYFVTFCRESGGFKIC